MDRDKGKGKALEPLEGTNIFRIKRKKIEDTSDGQKREGILEIMERGWKRMQEENRLRKMKMDAEAAEDKELEEALLDGTETEDTTEESEVEEEKTVLSPKESSTNNPKGMKRVREEEEEEEEEEKKLKAADSLSDTGTSKFPTSSPIDKFMDSDKDDQSTRSPPGDL